MQKQIVYLPNAVFERKINGVELATFALLTAYNGEVALPVGRIAEETSLGESVTRRSIRKLEARGWIAYDHNISAANRYRVLLIDRGADSFPLPLAALPYGNTCKLLVLAYLCSLAASGIELPPTPEISAALHLHPQTVREHLAALRMEGTSTRIPRPVAKLLLDK